jgi:hypothetical protein
VANLFVDHFESLSEVFKIAPRLGFGATLAGK